MHFMHFMHFLVQADQCNEFSIVHSQERFNYIHRDGVFKDLIYVELIVQVNMCASKGLSLITLPHINKKNNVKSLSERIILIKIKCYPNIS